MPGQPAYRGLYTYAWDLADEGVAEVAARARDAGLNTLTLAAAYHAGKFLRPHGVSGKVYFPEDGTVYFRATARALRPDQAAARLDLRASDPFADLARVAPDLGRVAWVVAATTPVSACSTPTSSPATASAIR